ncbi:MAG: hypothetical protein KatS3mg005_3059 [Bryobacteraceae bacterium]|nr:MAG: hypothetical protein KatS3mg005_3059 [Bryobacteraceae bacterium]
MPTPKSERGDDVTKMKLPLLCCALWMMPLVAQTADALDVEGIKGHIEVLTVADRSGTLIQVQPIDRREQVVLVLQYADKVKFMPDWKGTGTFYLSRGLVAFLGDDGVKRMAKFPNLPVPPSLGKLSMDNFEVVGIARYGQFAPLSEKQLANLRSFGTCSPNSGAPEGRQATAPQNLPAPGCGGMTCTSGGEGATSCSAGGGSGCSVSCSAGWYACCNANTNNCRCCKND